MIDAAPFALMGLEAVLVLIIVFTGMVMPLKE